MPTPLLPFLGQLGLEFLLVLEPARVLVHRPGADVGLDRADVEPQRDGHPLDQLRAFDLARRLRLDRAFDVGGAFRRKLTC